MNRSIAENVLRAEYFELLSEVRLVAEELETRIRYAILPIVLKLTTYERVRVTSRIKECPSAINSVLQRQELSMFDPNAPEKYTLTRLKDLAGVKVLVFPSPRIEELDQALQKEFQAWTSDHLPDPSGSGQPLMLKYHGYCNSSAKVGGEYQIVPMLTGLFLDVEHSALYKPTPELANVSRSLEMQERKKDVLVTLKSFEQEFARLVEENKS